MMDPEIKALAALKRTLKKIVESVPLAERFNVLDVAQREIDRLRLAANSEMRGRHDELANEAGQTL